MRCRPATMFPLVSLLSVLKIALSLSCLALQVAAQNKNSDDWDAGGTNPGIYVIAVLFVGVIVCVFCFGLYRFNKQRGKAPPATDLQEIRVAHPTTPFSINGNNPLPYSQAGNTPLPMYQLVDERVEYPWQTNSSTARSNGDMSSSTFNQSQTSFAPMITFSQTSINLHLPSRRQEASSYPNGPQADNPQAENPPPLRPITPTSLQLDTNTSTPLEPPPEYTESTQGSQVAQSGRSSPIRSLSPTSPHRQTQD